MSVQLAMFAVGTLVNMYSQNSYNNKIAAQREREAKMMVDIAEIDAEAIGYISAINSAYAKDIAGLQATMATNTAISKAASSKAIADAQGVSWTREAHLQKSIASANEALALMRMEDSLSRGKEIEAISRKKVKATIGAHRVKMAASGIDVGSGSAAEIQEEAIDLGEVNAVKIMNNARREAFGYKNQAINATLQGDMLSLDALFKAEQAEISGEYVPDLITMQGMNQAEYYKLAGAGQSQLYDITGDANVNLTLLGGQIRGENLLEQSRQARKAAVNQPFATAINSVLQLALYTDLFSTSTGVTLGDPTALEASRVVGSKASYLTIY